MHKLSALLFVFFLSAWVAAPTSAQTVIAQAGTNPISIDQTSTTDNVQVLLGTLAEHLSDMTIYGATDGRKNFYIYNFSASSDYLAWSVSVPTAANYEITALLSATSGQQLALTVNGGAAMTFTSSGGGWNRYAVGTVYLPAGTDRLVLTRSGTLSGDVPVKSVELLRSSDVAAYNSRVSAARANTTWFSQSKYGLMFQYGAWGYPNNVGAAKGLNQQAADFDVDAFVQMVQQSGATYVVWSISWWGYHMDAPLTTPNGIVASSGGPTSPGLAASTDLIGNVASALHAKGIRFLLYYHTGDEDTAWWPYQNFPTRFSATGAGDRSTFLSNWQTVVSEIGNRYGSDLDGFFFDDGMIYYPAPFEQLEQAARAGNANRLVSWNNWILPRFTDFQDTWFGEGSQGQTTTGSAAAGGNGIFGSGPYQGLLQHGMFTMDGDWGVHTQGGSKIATNASTTSNASISWATSAATRNVTVSFNLMMYEDGTVADSDLAVLNNVRQATYGTIETVPTNTTWVNDTSTSITYTGSWGYSTNRNAGDYSNDVHYTTANGNSFSYTFSGSGVDVLGPKSNISNHFDAYVDGVLIGTFSAYAATYMPQAVLYSARHLSAGTHTIKLVKDDSSYLQLDALRVVPSPSTINDTDASISYTGTWGYAGSRGVGDYANDVHYTTVDGNSASVTFTGTGIDLVGPMEPADGTASVTLDGAQIAAISAMYSGAYSAQQHYWGIRNQTPGPHTLTLTKTGGTYFQLDAVTVWP